MLDALRQLLESSHLLALFLAIGGGYALGQVTIFGFSLGVGAVLFAGLAIGTFAPGTAPPGIVGIIGLVMFLYGIGIQYGRQFFQGLSGPGRVYNAVAFAGVLVGLATAVAGGRVLGIDYDTAIGVFAGALTNTPALQAALQAAGNDAPAIGYSVAYPFGVIVPILVLSTLHRVFHPKVTTAAPAVVRIEVDVQNRGVIGRTVADVLSHLAKDVDIAAVRKDGENMLPAPDLTLQAGDAVLLVGRPEAVEAACAAIGPTHPGCIRGDREELDYLRPFVSRASLIGQPLASLAMPSDYPMRIVLIRRGDQDLLPAPAMVLEYGDRVGVLAPSERTADVRHFFGDSIKATAEFSYLSVGIGMVLGVLLGLIAVPVPGIGRVSLGIAGGPLVMALILGRLGRIGNLSWKLPLSANLTLRNFGLTLFLAAVGISSGPAFARTVVSPEGLGLCLLGAATVLASVATVVVLGRWVVGAPFDDLFGIISGTTGNPAILAHASRLTPTERPDVDYAMIHPAMTLVKIVAAQVIVASFPP